MFVASIELTFSCAALSCLEYQRRQVDGARLATQARELFRSRVCALRESGAESVAADKTRAS